MQTNTLGRMFGVAAIVIAGLGTPPRPGAQTGQIDRTVLPVPEPVHPPSAIVDVRGAKAPLRFEVNAPAGAPNVVIVLIDDMGFGQPGAFGGGISMPTLERIGREGLRYTNMHTAALCSPTRAALLTGRNHHTNNTGAVQDVATAFPGNTGKRPTSVAPLAEILRLNGYNTAAFGKWHLTPLWETTSSGPFDLWPTRSGFEKFYGFLGGETNQWAPLVYDGVTKIEPPHDPNYHFTTDMTTQAIAWVRSQQSLTPNKPFFVYYAPGATHAPHQVPQEWADKYKGKFDAGWDAYRQETLARQIKLGIVPPGTTLAPKPEAIRDWNSLSADERRLFARQMEVYAGFGEHTDHEVGRFVDALQDLGALDNTLFIYVAGDNGASAEGSLVGMFNEMSYFNGVPETVGDQLARVDEWGGGETFPHYAAGWAIAGNTPFTWAKQVASNFGGTATGMAIRWPKGIQATGELRTQFHHVIDLAPTVLELAHLPEPRMVNGASQTRMEGVSLAYSLNDSTSPSRHVTQYFEIAGNRGLYHDGWFAGTVHKAPWEATPRATLDKDRWELYDRRSDFSLAHDLSAKEPQKLREMQDLFFKEAAKYHVLPIDDRTLERLDPALAGRPDLMGSRTSLTLYEGMTGVMENAFINVKNRSHAITADVRIPAGGGGEGVIIAQAGRFGGWSLYMIGGKPTYTYNWIGRELYTVTAKGRLPGGKATIRVEFAYDGGGRGKGGTATLFVNGQKAGEVRVANTNANMFSLDEGTDVGIDEGTPVTPAYKEHDNRFSGAIDRIVVQVK